MSEWSEKVRKLKEQYQDNRWSPYAPQSKRGFDLLAQNENLACVLCESLVEVKGDNIPEADGSIVVACDDDCTPGAYKRVTLVPNVSAEGGATITSTSAHGCSRRLIRMP